MIVLRLLILGMLLQHLSFTTCNNVRTYFIKQSEDSPCAAQECLTLNQFVLNTTKDDRADIVLQVDVGKHIFPSRLTFANIKSFSMYSKDNNNTITCSQSAGFTFTNVRMVTLINLTFIGCGNSFRFNAVLQISHVDVNVTACTFLLSKGRVFEAVQANISTRNCTFKHSSAGVLSAEYNTIMLDIGSIYELNVPSTRIPALLYINSGLANFRKSIFRECSATISDMIHVKEGTLILKQCELANNRGRLVRSHYSSMQIYETKVVHNFISAQNLIIIHITNLTIDNSIFAHNVAKWRCTILFITESRVEKCHNLTITNNTSYYTSRSIIQIRDSEVRFGNFLYSNNIGYILVLRSKATFTKLSKFQSNKQVNDIYPYAGAMTSIASKIHFQGTTSFSNHDTWNRGSAIYAIESRVYAHGDTLFSDNEARSLGGALFLVQSDFICEKKCVFIGNTASKGGAIHAINSIITIGKDWKKYNQSKNVNSTLSFDSNLANEGGAIYLETNSKLRAPRGRDCNYVLEFDNNTAKIGGAIFVNDYTNICKFSTCFIQAPSFTLKPLNGRIKINSTSGNTTIYGGLLDRCIAKRRYNYTSTNFTSIIGINYMKIVTNNDNIQYMITSDPLRICYCYNRKVDCNYTYPTVTVKKGYTFKVPVAAVDQVNHTVDAWIFIKSTQNYKYHLGTEQRAQKVQNGCSDLTLNIFSPNDTVELTMYAKGPCQDVGISQTKLHVNFVNCICPIGFQQQKTQEDCVCDCDQQLKPLIKICDQSSKSLLRQGDFWINYINNTDEIYYLIYSHCPYDYCLPSTHSANINLNIPNGADAQCALYHTGLLCSSCKSGLSLSLGSSRCLACPKDWPKLFCAIALGAIASGVVLVVIILVLNLTVAVGTLNGLIFYANIMAANNITFCPLSKQNVFSVFIAWLNLELGLDTCFYKGLDTYSKVWLQFAFPAYLIAVPFVIIIMSKYSSRFAKLIGKRNPIATLATLVLLSYMKFLCNIIDVFSVADLRYPNGS